MSEELELVPLGTGHLSSPARLKGLGFVRAFGLFRGFGTFWGFCGLLALQVKGLGCRGLGLKAKVQGLQSCSPAPEALDHVICQKIPTAGRRFRVKSVFRV